MQQSKREAVLLFKPETPTDDNERFVKALDYAGYKGICIPTTQTCYKNFDALQIKLKSPENYAGIILTSPWSVKGLRQALQSSCMTLGWKPLRNYAMGEDTRLYIRNALQPLPILGKCTNNVQTLFDFILKTLGRDTNLPLLLPCSKAVNGKLRLRLIAHGYRVDACEVYAKENHPQLGLSLQKAIKTYYVEYLVFFTPASVQNVVNYCRMHDIDLTKFKLVALGVPTYWELRDLKLNIYRSSEGALVEHLINLLPIN